MDHGIRQVLCVETKRCSQLRPNATYHRTLVAPFKLTK